MNLCIVKVSQIIRKVNKVTPRGSWRRKKQIRLLFLGIYSCIVLHFIPLQKGAVLSKHLDTWWSGMEIKMAEILSRDDICNYFDLVGNHDDHNLYLFVKTAEHLCTLSYHCKLPTGKMSHIYWRLQKIAFSRVKVTNIDLTWNIVILDLTFRCDFELKPSWFMQKPYFNWGFFLERKGH